MDLKKASIQVELYKVADISAVGEYTATGSFSEMNAQLQEVSHLTTAEDWAKMAEQANKIKDANNLTADKSFVVSEGVGSISELPTGLYLVFANDTKTKHYGYSFTPYLISAPNILAGTDDYIYSGIEIDFKAEQKELLGDLEITKTLKRYNKTLGTPLFVFDVEAYDEDNNVVFSDVVSLSFDKGGVKKALVKDIPAGSNVVVTEVYSGASYQATASTEAHATIQAEEVAGVDFTNDYNDKLVYGTGVVNHFEYDGTGWEWKQVKDNE